MAKYSLLLALTALMWSGCTTSTAPAISGDAELEAARILLRHEKSRIDGIMPPASWPEPEAVRRLGDRAWVLDIDMSDLPSGYPEQLVVEVSGTGGHTGRKVHGAEAGRYGPAERKLAEVLAASLSQTQLPEDEHWGWLLDLPPQIRSALINALPRHRDAGVEAWVFLLEHDPLPNFRSRAASGLDPNHSPDVRNALIAALADEDANVRRFACQSLRLSEDRSVIEHIMPLLDDESPDTRRMTVRALGEFGAHEALPRIRELYQQIDPTDSDAHTFAGAFARLGDEAMALRAAEPLLDHRNWNVRYFVIRDLGFLESRQVVPMLINTLAIEMQLELNESFRLPTRVMQAICQQLDERTGESIGVDPRRWMDWWAEHSVDYGAHRDQATRPEGFGALNERYMRAIERGIAATDEPPALEPPVVGSAHLTARWLDPDDPMSFGGWSEPVHGLRARLFAPSTVTLTSGQPRPTMLVLALHNTTDQPLAMAMPRFAKELVVASDALQAHPPRQRTDHLLWKLDPGTMTLWAIELRHQPGSLSQVEHVEEMRHIERIEVPGLLPGRYALTVTIDLAADEDEAEQDADTLGLWHGKLTTRPVVVEFVEPEQRW